MRISLFIHTGLLLTQLFSYFSRWTIPELRGGDPGASASSLGPLLPPGWHPMEFCHTDLWRVCSWDNQVRCPGFLYYQSEEFRAKEQDYCRPGAWPQSHFSSHTGHQEGSHALKSALWGTSPCASEKSLLYPQLTTAIKGQARNPPDFLAPANHRNMVRKLQQSNRRAVLLYYVSLTSAAAWLTEFLSQSRSLRIQKPAMDFSSSDLSRCFLNLCQFLALWMSLSKELHSLIVCYMKNLLLFFTFSIPCIYFIQYLMFLHWKDGDQLPLVHLFHVTYLWTFTKTFLLHQHLPTMSVSVYSVSPLWKTFHNFEHLLVFPASFSATTFYIWKIKAGCWLQDTCIVIQTLIFIFSILFCFPFLTTPKTKFPFPGLAWNWSNPQILFLSRRSQSNTSTEHRILLLLFCLYALPFIFCIGV